MMRSSVPSMPAVLLDGPTPSGERGPDAGERAGSSVPFLLLGLLLFAAAMWPLAVFRHLGLQDYANHLARAWILTHLDDPAFGAHFRAAWQFIPDLAFDAWMVTVGRMIDVFEAGRWFVVLTSFLTVAGVATLARVLHGAARTPQLIAVPLLFHFGFSTGLLAFDMAIGTMLFAAAAWEGLGEGRRGARLVVGAIFCLLLWSMHVVGLGAYGLWVIGARLRDLSGLRAPGALRRRVVDLAIDGAQVLPVAVLMLAARYGVTESSAAAIPRGFQWPWTRLVQIQRLIDIGPELLNFALVAVVWGVVMLGLAGGRLALDRRIGPAVAMALLLFFVLPNSLGDAHQIAWRALLIAALFSAAGLRPTASFGPAWAASLVGAFAVAVVAGSVATARDWEGVEAAHRDMSEALAEVPAGSRLLYVQTRTPRNRDERREEVGLYHLASFATIEKRLVVLSTFAIPGQHPLRFRDPVLQANPRHSMTRVRDILTSVERTGFDYAAVLDRTDFVLVSGPDEPQALFALGGRNFERRARVGGFTLYAGRSRADGGVSPSKP